MLQNQSLFEFLFNRDYSDTGNIGFLKEITGKHPYFSPAQFYLLHKTEKGSDEYDKQVCKTNILFNNPHWLHFQLQQTGSGAAISISQQHSNKNAITANSSEEPAITINQAKHIPTEEMDNASEAEIEPMKIELKLPELKTNSTEELLFEPMHVVDYFASQGIKLNEDAQTADKLGRQMKSFTEWLKTMKKVHESGSLPETQNDELVQTLAEKSNAENEVLTVSMAEVYIKQGKKEKAIEIFEKLSLLNPAKSAYFAAKIENLK